VRGLAGHMGTVRGMILVAVAGRYVAAALLLIALGGASAVGRGTATTARLGHVLRRVRGGSAAAFRWFGASRAGLAALCGTVLGAVAGCPIGMALRWPLTAPGTWDSPARLPFETPWTTVAAVVVGLPVLAAVFGAVVRDYSRRRTPAGR
ncbi:hypothetical protein JYK22_13100, partial [Nonomuraea sp. RK-328]|nr:hypothetical protein [Nonomuraea sp. RK-328]